MLWQIISGTAEGFAHFVGNPMGLFGLVASITVIALFSAAFSKYTPGEDNED